MNRPEMMDRLDQCVEVIREVQRWAGQYTDAGVQLTLAMNNLGRANHFISEEHKIHVEGKA